MSTAKRVIKILSGLMTIICSILMMRHPDVGCYIVVLILDVSLLLFGLRLLIYYFTMARYMVGGIATLYKSIIVIDFGLFVFGLSTLPQRSIMLYLIGCLTFSGAIDILDALMARKLEGSWKYQFSYGAIEIIVSIVCLFFLDSFKILTVVYCAGLIESAIMKMIGALRKTAIVYIE